MGKAEELMDHMLKHPLTPEEMADAQRPIGVLQLAADMPSVEIGPTTGAQEVLKRLDSERAVALTGHESGILAVTIPVKTYLTLLRNSINGQSTDFRLERATLPVLHVEEVSPHDQEAPTNPLGEASR